MSTGWPKPPLLQSASCLPLPLGPFGAGLCRTACHGPWTTTSHSISLAVLPSQQQRCRFAYQPPLKSLLTSHKEAHYAYRAGDGLPRKHLLTHMVMRTFLGYQASLFRDTLDCVWRDPENARAQYEVAVILGCKRILDHAIHSSAGCHLWPRIDHPTSDWMWPFLGICGNQRDPTRSPFPAQ